MGKRGPRGEPTSVKLARGTHRRDRHGDPDSEPTPNEAQIDDVPEGLLEHGRRVWISKAPAMKAMGLLTDSDTGAFHTYCRSHDEIAKYDAVIEKEGETYTTEKGFVGQHPAVNQRLRWLEIKLRYEREFGMTPSARSGLKVEKPKQSGVMKRTRA